MSSAPLNPEEARQLADAMFDRRMNAQTIQRLEDLITNDLGCLQAYVERIDFHGALQDQALELTPSSQAADALGQIARASARRQRRQVWLTAATISLCLMVVAGTATWLAVSGLLARPRIGMIANLTSDLRSKMSLELGQVVSQGKTVQLSEGIATIQLPNVTVDVVGPARLRMLDSQNLELLSGTVHVLVREAGRGFTVRTRDSVVVDLGTEFTVTHAEETGSEVSVRRGRVQASLRDWNGTFSKILDITADRAAILSRQQQSAREVAYDPVVFNKLDRVRGTIQTIDGMLRTTTQPPKSLASKQQPTPNYMLIIPEKQQVVLQADLDVIGSQGPVHIPAGTAVSSYLVHYDPDLFMNRAPRGAVTFDGQVAAVLVSTPQLVRTDEMFGLENLAYEQTAIRELELDEDEVHVSDDRKTVSFYFGVSGTEPLDQVRVLVVGDAP